jgi:signal transduction histidine kinase
VVEDSTDDYELVLRALASSGRELVTRRVETAGEMEAALAAYAWDVVLSDYSLPGFDGLAAFALLRKHDADVPFLLVSGTVGEDVAVAALKAGVQDYLLKDRLSRLAPAVEREIVEAEARRERRKLEEQFRQAQKMEALGSLAGGVAHDFNNLLTTILGYTELLTMRHGDEPELLEDLREIKKAGERASALTQQLLAFSRKQVVERRVIDLNAVIEEFQRMLQRLVGVHIEVRAKLAPHLGAVRADVGQIEQVLMNLVVNARDAMPEGGVVTIETRDVEVPALEAREHAGAHPGPHVRISVSDTGTGIPRDVLPRLFEPFFTTKAPGKGTGLGLSTVYGIVSQNGGHLRVASEEGAGTTFSVYLPRSPGSVAGRRSSMTMRALPEGRGNVLVVDDQGAVRALASRVLHEAGYTVREAESAERALELALDATPIDLLLTDSVMTGLSGVRLAEALRSTRPSLKVIFMSGYSEPDLLEAAADEGTAFLPKPFTPQDLAKRVREVLEEAG